MKSIVGVVAAAAYLTAYGLIAGVVAVAYLVTSPFRWTWRATLGMSTAMAGEEAGYMLACVFVGLAGMGAMVLAPIGLAHLVLG